MNLPSHFRRVRQMLLRRGTSAAEAEDLIQEAFLKMQEYCQKGGEIQQPEAFLVRTALRLRINARRDQHRDIYVEEDIDELALIIDTGPAPDEVIAAEECLKRMSGALDAVGRRTRDVFFMHRLDGFTYSEIARRLGISVSAIEKHMASALVALAGVNDWR